MNRLGLRLDHLSCATTDSYIPYRKTSLIHKYTHGLCDVTLTNRRRHFYIDNNPILETDMQIVSFVIGVVVICRSGQGPREATPFILLWALDIIKIYSYISFNFWYINQLDCLYDLIWRRLHNTLIYWVQNKMDDSFGDIFVCFPWTKIAFILNISLKFVVWNQIDYMTSLTLLLDWRLFVPTPLSVLLMTTLYDTISPYYPASLRHDGLKHSEVWGIYS